ncbi:MAG: hypothetical protein IKW21_05245 [Lachnospiraceae bacterium]|nr:hypothetical protein [Lachnospiraceae bacterium]
MIEVDTHSVILLCYKKYRFKEGTAADVVPFVMPMKKKKYQYRLIDNNWSWYPVAWCKAKRGCLTEKLMKTHQCKEKNCPGLDRKMEFE